MGSWGARTFDNDTTMDWLHELHASSDFALVQKTLLRLTGPPERYSQSAVEEEALAAAEIVASWLGHPPPGKQGLDEWVRKHTDWFTPEILRLALQAVATIKTNSQLRDMWKDRSGAVDARWLDSVADLERRLESSQI